MVTKNWYHRSLATRLTVSILLIISAVGIVWSAVVLESEEQSLQEQLDEWGQDLADVASATCVEAILTKDYPIIDNYGELLVHGKSEIAFVRVTQSDGRVISESYATGVQDTEVEGSRYEYFANIESTGDHPTQLGRVTIGISPDRFNRFVDNRVKLSRISIFVAVAAIAVLLVTRLRTEVVKPLEHLDQKAQLIGEGNFDAAIQNERHDEIGRLASSLDRMRRKLKVSYQDLSRQNEELKELDRMKNEFMANISHELRTPLSGVIGMTRLALDTELDPEQREHLTTARKSALFLLKIINQILDFSMIEAGQVQLSCGEFQLRDELDDVFATLAVLAHEKDLELCQFIENDVPDKLIGDVDRINQIIINLVGNAIKFTPDGEIRLAVQKQAESNEGVTLRVTVTDTGIGIPIEKQGDIFDVFLQTGASAPPQYGSAGLGLSITKKLVELMGGHVFVESCPGVGSTFGFEATFPVRSEETDPSPLVACLRDVPALIIDENISTRESLQSQLIEWGMVPRIAENREAALELLQENQTPQFGIVFMDAGCDEKDGNYLSRHLLNYPSLHRRVIYMIRSDSESRRQAKSHGLEDARICVKPIRRRDLLTLVRHELSEQPIDLQPSFPMTFESLSKPNRLETNIDSASKSKAHVLVADDDPVNRSVVKSFLERKGYTVRLADDGYKVLELLEEYKFDIILMDVQMPEMDGLVATQAIRAGEMSFNRHTPIVALTAHAMSGDDQRFLEAGMDAYLSKPIEPESLFATLDALLTHETA